MDIDLTPRLAKQVYGGDGGSYSAWSPSELPMLREGDIGAAKLSLEKDGFALPNYSDSARVAYVLQGNGVVGIVLPEKEEKVLPVKKGDALALPFGVITWWHNKEDTEFVVLFLGDTKTAHKRGEFTDMYLNGSNGIFTGFSTEFVNRAWDLEESVVKTLVGNQIGKGIVKLGGANLPEPNKEHRDGMTLNCEEAPLDVDIEGGGRVVVLNTKNLPLVGEVGLGADLVRLDGSAMCLTRWWRGREREDGSESGSDVSEKDSGWEREGAEGRERRRVKKKRWGSSSPPFCLGGGEVGR
ncbi:hypothetical protein ACLB2K_052175 [Fragaria x ananassa]